ncbi:TIGR00730 family Rossman fold protein [Hyphomicrobium sp.]|uniref:LOG family protein n=1 Tax=Hyphomicrobium sp. TaxID=82 RepID=UPI003FA5E710
MPEGHSGLTALQHVNGKPLRHTGPVRSICVYCGSGLGENPAYAAAARTLGQALAENGIRLIYGGGGLGLMGEVARATLEAGGQVTGIIPEFLIAREHMLREVTDILVTSDMHQRKKLMFERSDAFVALPGGIGTLEELVEQLTWAQLGQHSKPIVVADIARFWTPFLGLLEHMRDEAFIRRGLEVPFSVVSDASQIVPRVIAHYDEAAVEVAPGALAKF